jgi:hypothetical protein
MQFPRPGARCTHWACERLLLYVSRPTRRRHTDCPRASQSLDSPDYIRLAEFGWQFSDIMKRQEKRVIVHAPAATQPDVPSDCLDQGLPQRPLLHGREEHRHQYEDLNRGDHPSDDWHRASKNRRDRLVGLRSISSSQFRPSPSNRSRRVIEHRWNRITCQPRLWPRLAHEPTESGFLRCRASRK